jgi:hypothetical protein
VFFFVQVAVKGTQRSIPNSTKKKKKKKKKIINHSITSLPNTLPASLRILIAVIFQNIFILKCIKIIFFYIF